MVRKTLAAVLVVLPLSAGVAAGASRDAVLAEVQAKFGPPVMWVARPAAAPVIDGKLDDKVWAEAQPVALGFLTGRWETPTQKTEARLLADSKAIYFAVKCFESEPQRVIAAGRKRDGDLWNGDTLEFFLDPGHKSLRHQYVQVIINPKGLIYDSKNNNTNWNADLSVKVGRFEGGWTVEMAVPMAELGVEGAVPNVWGLNVNRQRPELGEIAPVRGITSTAVPLKEPDKYREGEDTAWSPTYCRSSHVVQRFGHAVLEVGSVKVAPPERLFEIIYKNDFDGVPAASKQAGGAAGWSGVDIVEENFRGPGRCIAPKEGKGAVQFTVPLRDLDDVTLIMALKMPQNGRLYYYGRAPDNEQCESDRHEIFMTEAAIEARKFPALHDYDTHGSMMAWKSHGRRRQVPGPWQMMTGHFSEPSIGSVMYPGTEWVVVRTRLGMMRRQRSQGLVPMEQNYPRGLTFAAGEPYLIDDFVIFRGVDLRPPEAVSASYQAAGDKVKLQWGKARDNTLTAYYELYGDGKKLAETHQLSALVPGGWKKLTVVAVDFYGNRSEPAEAAGPAKQ
jgi:hypothetical protein